MVKKKRAKAEKKGYCVNPRLVSQNYVDLTSLHFACKTKKKKKKMADQK